MKNKFVLVLMLTGLLAAAIGCKTEPSGSREFIPGKGWVPTK